MRLAGDEEVAVGDGLRLAAQAAAQQPLAPIAEVELVHGPLLAPAAGGQVLDHVAGFVEHGARHEVAAAVLDLR